MHKVPDAVMDGTSRAMRVTLSREMEKLEANLPLLATIGFDIALISVYLVR